MRTATQPRLFRLVWNNRHLAITDNDKVRTCEGTIYSNGFVSLSNGACFESIMRLWIHFDRMGDVDIRYLDEEDDDEQVLRPLLPLYPEVTPALTCTAHRQRRRPSRWRR